MRRPASRLSLAAFVASDGALSERFGWSTAISGKYAVVAWYKVDLDTGAADIYERDGLPWNEIGRLPPTPVFASGDEYGRAVAISERVSVVGA